MPGKLNFINPCGEICALHYILMYTKHWMATTKDSGTVSILNSLTDARNQSNASVLCGMSVFCIEEHMAPRKGPVSR